MVKQVFLLASVLCLAGCTEKGGCCREPDVIPVDVLPDPMLPLVEGKDRTYRIEAGTVHQFHAVTYGGERVDDRVFWRIHPVVKDGTLGTLTQTGLYTAPAKAPPNAPEVSIQALQKDDYMRYYMGQGYIRIVPKAASQAEPATDACEKQGGS